MDKINFVKQTSINDCGIACVLMILKERKINITMNELRSKMHITKDGVSAYEIIRIFKKYNIKCVGYKDLPLEDIKLPAIIHTTNPGGIAHYVILLKVLKNSVLIADPLKKIIYVSKKEFLNIYSNIALIFEDDNYYLKNIFKNKKLIIKLLIYSIAFSFLSLLFSYFFSFIINNKNIYIGIIFFFLIGIFKDIISYIRTIFALKFKTLIDKTVTIPILKNLFDLPYNFYQKNGSGAILSKINDLSYVKEMIFKFIEVFLINFIIVIFSFFILIMFDIKLICVNIIYFLILLLINKKYLKFHFCDTFDLQMYNQSLNNKIVDYFNSILLIKNFMKENFFKRKLSKTYSNYIEKYEFFFKSYIKKELCISIVTTIFIVIYIIILVNSNFSISNIIFIYSIENLIINSLNEIFSLQPLYTNFKVTFLRIKNLLNKESKHTYKNVVINKVSFKDVNYKYDKKYILRNISFEINKGDFVLIVGKSGSGKTTLFKLLTNQIEGSKKGIYINNIDINNYNYDEIRNNILYLDQKSKLLNESIEDNIFMGEKTNDNILKITLVNEILKENKIDLDYVIDNTNTNLSNGQISKILIARALSSNKNFIILDEITSSLDSVTERIILTNIKKNYKNKTIIVINHRNENKDIFNKIVRLDNLNDKNGKEYYEA